MVKIYPFINHNTINEKVIMKKLFLLLLVSTHVSFGNYKFKENSFKENSLINQILWVSSIVCLVKIIKTRCKGSPIPPEFHYPSFSKAQLEIMQRPFLSRLISNTFETFQYITPKTYGDLTTILGFVKIASTIDPQHKYFNLFTVGSLITLSIFGNTLKECTKSNLLRAEWQKIHNRIQALNPDFKVQTELEWVGAIPDKILQTLTIMANEETQARAIVANITNPNGFLFHGPPGNGKTFLARAIAQKIGASFMEEKASDLLSKWIGESEKNITDLITKATNLMKKEGKKSCIILLDEIEGLVPDRNNQSKLSAHEVRIVDAFLQVIEEAAKHGILIIATTNYPHSIDKAIKRSGRLEPIEIKHPNQSEKIELIKYYTKRHFHTEPSDYFVNHFYKKLAQDTTSRADVMAALREFAMQSIRIPQGTINKLKATTSGVTSPDYLDRLLDTICSL